MSFPNDVKMAMRNCILQVLWAKNDIVSFFEGNSCTKSDIKAIGEAQALSRSAIVDAMFNHLSMKPDEGLGQFRAMLCSLVNWSHFDPYYFDKLQKLNRADAERAITHLKQLQEIRDSKIHQDRKDRELKEATARATGTNLAQLKDRFIALLQGASQGAKRGYELEQILQAMCKLAALEATEPFRVNGEQIDGAVKYDGEHYLLEAKWQEKAASNEAVYQFAGKVEGKMYGRGIFVSIHGFSDDVIRSLATGKAIRTIFVDGGDLIIVLEGILGFAEMLDRKIKAAQTKGLIYVDARNGKSKVG
ncbi:restriction endonuclease [Pseudomonas fluorescens]|uniref:restriction endonuclease n=1 Tax=Pseudomonas fluorescens TaxID=294 RepID=UPI00381554F4